MSSVSNVGSDLYNLFQSLQQAGPNAAQSAAATGAGQPPANAAGPQAASGQSGHRHHLHGMRSQIESAVTQALKSSDGKTDPNKVVQDAIASVFAKYQQGGNTTSQAGGSTAPGTPPTSSSTDDRQAFAQLLQSYGIDKDQFHKDMQAAMQNSDGSTVDFSKLFKSFPVGSGLDATA